MPVLIQIQDVPDRIYRVLKARSALAGKSLGDFILDELVAVVAVPSAAKLKARLREAKPFAMKKSSAAIVRNERDKE